MTTDHPTASVLPFDTARRQWTGDNAAARQRIAIIEGCGPLDPALDAVRADVLHAIAQARAQARARAYPEACAQLALALRQAEPVLREKARLDARRSLEFQRLRYTGAQELAYLMRQPADAAPRASTTTAASAATTALPGTPAVPPAPVLAALAAIDPSDAAASAEASARALGWLDALLAGPLDPETHATARARRLAIVHALLQTTTTRDDVLAVAELAGPDARRSFDRQDALGPLDDTVRASRARAQHAATRLQNVANAENVDHARLLAGRLIGDDGGIELAALYLFDPRDLAGEAPSSRQMARALTLLRDSPEALATLESIEAPAPSSTAARVIRATLGLAPDAVPTAADARRAALSSLLCELRQSEAGSCFATQTVIRMHDTEPAAYLQDIADMLREGKVTRRLLDGTVASANCRPR